MAAASAGALKSCTDPIPGCIQAIRQPLPMQPPHSQQIIQHQQILHKPQYQQKQTLISKIDESGRSVQRCDTIVSLPSTSTILANSSGHQQQLIYKSQQQICPNGPNVSKGWRRLIIKGDIVYLSPSGTVVTSLENVKEYLLKSGTCKCGLPCPLRPDQFFDFDVQVPNIPLKSSYLESSYCTHVQNSVQMAKPRKIVKESNIQKTLTLPNSSQIFNSTNVNNIVNIQKYAKPRTPPSNILNPMANNSTGQIQNHISNDTKLSNLNLTRSPPWRKKTYIQQTSLGHTEIILNNNERVPPLPIQHIPPPPQSFQQTPQPQQVITNWRDDNKNIRSMKTNNNMLATNNSRTKKRPNFRDDPNGYLEQQTAILQNSILSVPSPDIPIVNEQHNVIQPNNQNITINNSPVQIFNNNQHQVINISPNGSNCGNYLNQNHHQNFPMQNNQIIIQQNNNNEQVIQHPQNQLITGIPHSTTFCGQTVTHMPNGVVQIQHQNSNLQHPDHQPRSTAHPSNQQQSCSHDITIQQQIQLQQQIQQQNQLIRQTHQQLQQNNNFIIHEQLQQQEQQQLQQQSHNEKLLAESQESPVSSSTTIFNQNPDSSRISPDSVIVKGPVQGGTISTSNDSTSSSASSSPIETLNENVSPTNQFRLTGFASSETTSKNTITSVLAGRTMTATTSVNPTTSFNTGRTLHYQQDAYDDSYSNKNLVQSIIPVSNHLQDLQLHQLSREENGGSNQFIMTSNGQIILMSNKSVTPQSQTQHHNQHHPSVTNQMIISNNSNANQSQSFSLDNHNIHNNVQILSPPNIMHTQHSNKHNFNNFNNVILSPNSANSSNNHNISNNIIGPQQQTVVLNAIPSGFMLQPNFVDGSQVIINQNNNNNSYVQQQLQISPDSKRRPKKRKNSLPPHSPTTISVPQQNQSLLQIAQQYSPQNFQLSPSLSGITIIPNQHKNSQQQIIMSHQNGQIIQPINLIGQQLLVPAGLVVTPDTALLQIQNCGPILTQQGMVLRAQSPQSIQNKSFLSPNGQGQFIVSSNGQVSPMGQIYSTPVGLVVPQTNSGQTFVQQNTTIVQQQTTLMNNNNKNLVEQESQNIGHSVSTQTAHNQQQSSSLPPDTTTHSPTSPERPNSSKSVINQDQTNMAMVQCVSSSEPDSVVSPFTENGQSPVMDYNDRNTGFSNYQQTNYKSSDTKIRRVESITSGHKMMIDNQNDTSSLSTNATNHQNSNQISFCIGELIWGSVKGYPAWPGKLINSPDGITTNNDSTWVQWFGRKPNIELIPIKDLKSLSDGLDAHHKAQKDIRKSRKLNSQLENAIQEAMTELDRMSTNTTKTKLLSPNTNKTTKSRRLGNTTTQHRLKPVKIAPAPPIPISTLDLSNSNSGIVQNALQFKTLRNTK